MLLRFFMVLLIALDHVPSPLPHYCCGFKSRCGPFTAGFPKSKSSSFSCRHRFLSVFRTAAPFLYGADAVAVLSDEPPAGLGCTRKFLKYVPSRWEQEWTATIHRRQCDSFKQCRGACEAMRRKQSEIGWWIKTVGLRRRLGVTNGSAITTTEEHLAVVKREMPGQGEHRRRGVFSQFQFSDSCVAAGTVSVSYIEPLVGFLRHPRFFCQELKSKSVRRPNVVTKNFYWLPFPEETDRGRVFLFDAGASVYDKGPGGASQKWFVDEYESMGFSFHRILGWEAKPYTHEEIWSPVPDRIKPILEYHNVPVSADPNSATNLLNHIRNLTRPEDFVVLKIDIDNSEIEFALIAQILQSPDLQRLIDELFWEHHVLRSPVGKWWGDMQLPANQTLALSYWIFSKLRHLGIRAHSWV